MDPAGPSPQPLAAPHPDPHPDPNAKPNVYVATLLIALYTFCVALVVVSFSAHVIRSDWDARLATSGDGVNDFNSLGFFIKQERVLLADLAAKQDEVKSLDSNITEVTARRSSATAARDAMRLAHDEALSVARVHIVSAAGVLDDDEMAQLALILPDLDMADVSALLGALFFMKNVGTVEAATSPFTEGKLLGPPSVVFEDRRIVWARSEELEANLSAARDALHLAELDLQSAESDVQRAHEARSFQELEKAELESALAAVRALVPVHSEHRARYALFFEEKRAWNPMPLLVQSPTILLTLLATIAAGALGTLVSFSRSTFRHADISHGQLLIIIGEGIAAAIAVFLFAGAGMLVLSQGGGADGRLELSPFTVAFLAFLSGFMSEQAFDKIRDKGKDLFGDKDSGGEGNGAGA